MLTLCEQTFEPIWTDFGSGITQTEEWRQNVNAMGEIPVLIEDGLTLTQTAPVLLRLAHKFGRFQGSTESESFEILRWLFWDNQKLSGFMAAYRYRRAFLDNSNPHVLAFMKGRIDDFLQILESRLSRSEFVAGDKPTIADLSMTGYLNFPPNESGFYFEDTHPAIHAWLRRIAALPGWVAPYDILPGKRLRCYA